MAAICCRSIKRGKDEIPDFFPQINGQKEVILKIQVTLSNPLLVMLLNYTIGASCLLLRMNSRRIMSNVASVTLGLAV
jgi:hypothetical protein